MNSTNCMNRTNRTNRMNRKNRSRKIFIYLLALLLITASFPISASAEDEIDQATAATMRMRKIEGTVRGTDKKGKAISVFQDMKLYDGYNIETLRNGYAWIELDSTKLIKLDSESRTMVQKSGRELDIVLKKGKLFFDVAQPLEDDESFYIRTSNTMVGIRGTCGWVEVAGKDETRVFILEGAVTVAVIDPVTREVKVDIISGGDSASGVVYDPKKPGDKCDIIRNRFTEKDVPGFAAVEIVGDMKHVDEIFNKSKTDVDLRRLTQTEAKKQLQAEQEAVRLAEEKKTKNAAQDDNGGNDSKSPVTPETPDTPAPPVTAVTLDADGLTVAEIQRRLNEGESVIVNGAFTVDGDLTVPKDPTLTFNGQTGVASGKSVTVNGTMNAKDEFSNSGTMNVNGTMNTDGGLTNNGKITVNSSNSLNVNAELNTQGGRLTASKTGKVKAKKLIGSVDLEPGAQVLVETIGGTSFNAINGFTFENGNAEWTDDEGGYSRYEYTAWKFDSGTLTIAGNGKMGNYSRKYVNGEYITTAPWADYIPVITKVEVQDGVTSIGDSAFYRCSSLTGITMPSGVTSIGEYAFWGCGSLTEITMPSGVTSIGSEAFSFCCSLKGITLPGSVTSIGNSAFYCCCSLTEITMPNGVTSIGNSAFNGCSSLKEIAIPSGVTSISGSAFAYCRSLTKITIPSGVKSIGDGAFSDCSSLKEITIPGGVTSIEGGAFYGCSSLTKIAIPSGVTSIRDYAFYYCSSLTEIAIPGGVTSIGDGTFKGCSSLTEITIPSSVTSIGPEAFSGCSSLTEITIPSGVTSIGNGTFKGCSSLMTEITIPSSVTRISAEAFKGCISLTEITIQSGVTSIGPEAFSGCSSLTKITIPSSVTSIRDYAFKGCSKLENVYFGDTETQWSSALDGYGIFYEIYPAPKVHYNSTGPDDDEAEIAALSENGTEETSQGTSAEAEDKTGEETDTETNVDETSEETSTETTPEETGGETSTETTPEETTVETGTEPKTDDPSKDPEETDDSETPQESTEAQESDSADDASE